ncbi:MAG: regulatory iron-sulfur-containing complex subunit RicT [Fermentimonas sp.]|jgi:cell fate regulator YaaT (PSP1 superfamily)
MDKEQLVDKMAATVPLKAVTVRNEKSCCGCMPHTNKLHTYDWLHDSPEFQKLSNMVEVQFKNTRKGYYVNSNNLELEQGDLVAVEATPGHDVGTVTLTGKLVEYQMKKNHFRPDPNGGVKRVYRVARPADIEKYEQAKAREQSTMIRSRQIAEELGLQMKIGDVEYQGDGNKAIFYYIADERVDFRQLIKVLASEFRVKIEMKQIGARQEAGRIGGIGPCGGQLCCSSWMSSFVSVSTSAARVQDIAINPQKLAGQCGKLKCCMNYEVDLYIEAQRDFPSREIVLETRDADYYHFKADVLAGKITYSTDKNNGANLVTIPKVRAFEVISMNKQGRKPLTLAAHHGGGTRNKDDFNGKDLLEEESITRFDTQIGSQPKRRRKSRKRRSNASERAGRRANASMRTEASSSGAQSTGSSSNASPQTGKKGQRKNRSSKKRRSPGESRSSGERKPSGGRNSSGERKSAKGERRSPGDHETSRKKSARSAVDEKKSPGRDD